MQKQNAVATAAYFTRRAHTATTPARRLQLEAAAEFYRAKAKSFGETLDAACDDAPARVSRRDKLAELFRTYEAQKREWSAPDGASRPQSETRTCVEA